MGKQIQHRRWVEGGPILGSLKKENGWGSKFGIDAETADSYGFVGWLRRS